MAKKVKGFEDFQREGEKEKLQKIKRSFKPNSDQQQFTTNTRNEFDETTRKITAVTKDEVDDKLKSLEETNEGMSGDISKQTNEGIDNNSTNLREELNSLLKDFNLEKDLESKWKKAGVVRTFLKNNDGIEGVNDEFLWEVFDTYCEHLGSFATAMVYTGNDINDGIEMVDNGYLFDIDGFNPFEG
jgi:hypothetical protein